MTDPKFNGGDQQRDEKVDEMLDAIVEGGVDLFGSVGAWLDQADNDLRSSPPY